MTPRACLPVVSLVLFVAACGTSSEPDGPRRCNGLEVLCERRVDEVVFAGTHNAHAAEDDGFIVANQFSGLEAQLHDGIRAFMLDTYEEEGELLLCHGFCGVGSIPLVQTLETLRRFLETHPNEVLLLIMEDYISARQTEVSFEAAQLVPYLYAHPVDRPWPTLGSMIEQGQRVVVFAQNNGGADEPDWYLDLFEQSWDTPYAAKTPEELKCTHGRGDRSKSLWVMNHFLTVGLGGKPDLAKQVNFNPFLHDRIRRCEEQVGRLPNVIAVDFYQLGDLVATVNELNTR